MKQNIIIVDDFYSQPYEVRKFALECDYKADETHTYPGKNSTQEFYDDDIHGAFESLLQRKLIPSEPNGYFRISLEDDTFEQDVHIDPFWDWGAVIYLNLPHQCEDESGTSFWKHKKLGWERCPTEQTGPVFGYTNYEEIRQGIVYGDGLDRSKWNRYALANMKYNRLVLFDSLLWHSHGSNFGTNMENGRLVQLFFFKNA